MDEATYAQDAADAIRLLSVAVIYIEDGAPSTALARVQDAIVHLNKMIAARNSLQGKL